MRDLPGLIDGLIEVAKAAAPLVGVSPQAITVAEKIVEVIDHVAQGIDSHQTGEVTDGMTMLMANRDALEKSVNEHVDRTAAALRGS